MFFSLLYNHSYILNICRGLSELRTIIVNIYTGYFSPPDRLSHFVKVNVRKVKAEYILFPPGDAAKKKAKRQRLPGEGEENISKLHHTHTTPGKKPSIHVYTCTCVYTHYVHVPVLSCNCNYHDVQR